MVYRYSIEQHISFAEVEAKKFLDGKQIGERKEIHLLQKTA
jgi:hypothetical protein